MKNEGIYRKNRRTKRYNVICFNINNVRYSDCWDCLAETISPQTERLDHQKLSNFVEVYFSNGSGGEKRDWWYNIESSLLITSAALCSWQHEDEMMKKY